MFFLFYPPLLSFFLSFSRIGDANSGTTTFLSPLDVRQKRKKKERKKLKKKKRNGALQGPALIVSFTDSSRGSNPFLRRSGSANEFPRNVSRIEKGVSEHFFRDFFSKGT